MEGYVLLILEDFLCYMEGIGTFMSGFVRCGRRGCLVMVREEVWEGFLGIWNGGLTAIMWVYGDDGRRFWFGFYYVNGFFIFFVLL